MTTYAIIDFETTGLSPDHGDRATEVAAVIVRGGQIVDRYQSLINPRRPIPYYVQELTGITEGMVRNAPDAKQVMQELHQRIGHIPLVAHNASFDRKFLDCEYQRAGLTRSTEFACSLLLARRIYPQLRSHKLGELVRQLRLPTAGVHHRAMADAEMTTHLITHMISELQTQGLSAVTHDLMRKLQGLPRLGLSKFIASCAAARCAGAA
ncbi:MAG: hypothetical protein RLZZ227_1158 [Pseudomonadota bacterium]